MQRAGSVAERARALASEGCRYRKSSIALRQPGVPADDGPVTIFARLLSTPAPLRSALAWRRTFTAAFAASALAVFLFAAAPAHAVVTKVGGVTVGLQPRISSEYLAARDPKTYANPSGNPVLHGEGVYAVYWDPDDEYWSEWQNGIDTYLQNAGAASGSLHSVFAVDTQYTDKSNSPASYSQTYKGSYVDYHAYPTSGCTDPEPFEAEDQIPLVFGGTPTAVCLTSAQMAAELEAFIAQHALPKGMGNVYYLLTPPGVTVCLDGGGATGHCSDSLEGSNESYDDSFCSYHAAINPGGSPSGSASTVLYAVIPWTAGGYGDNKLVPTDQKPGWDCQDGGIDATGHGYEFEKAKEKNKKETEAYEEMDAEEKAVAKEAVTLEGPHEQEPNQQPCPSTAGTCDYGLFDLITNQISLEQQNMVTDPLLNAWQDSDHYENTDECRFLFGPVHGGGLAASEETFTGTLYNQLLGEGKYYLNDAFNLAGERLPYPGADCLDNVNLDPKFTSPNPVNAGEVVGFDGMESDIALDAAIDYSAAGAPQPNYATYTWNFGDGTSEVTGYAPGSPQCETPWLSPCAASLYHTYQYGGNYEVTLTVRDVGGNTATASHTITVAGTPPPSGSVPGTSATTTPTGGAATQSGASSSPGASPTVVPAPVAAAAILPQSLRSALRKGLVVSYSVNEQVAGRFEVLLSRTTAHRLGISGALATGLPAGSPAELVIAKAILVTTKGGHSAVHIEFSKRTAARLAHAHKVLLTLRLIVRNAASSNPATTTVVSAITLG
jgi:hypothetical protein